MPGIAKTLWQEHPVTNLNQSVRPYYNRDVVPRCEGNFLGDR